MKFFPYVNYGGNCEAALRYYEKHLGGRILSISRHGEMPGATMPEARQRLVMHARIEIGGVVIMASDVPPDMGKWEPMRSAYLTLSFDSDAETERAYEVLRQGGEVFMPIQEQFFATRFAMLRDQFGANWMVIHEKPMP